MTQTPPRLVVDLPVGQPFDAQGTFRFLASRAVAGMEVVDVATPSRLRYARTMSLPHGPGTVDIVASAGDGGWELGLHLVVASPADEATAVQRVRKLLDLDADPVAIDAALSLDPHLAPLVGATPGMRVPGAVDSHELLVRAIVGQQISVVRATAQLARLVEATGSRWASPVPGLTRLFPTPSEIVEHVHVPAAGEALDPDRPLRLPGRSVRTVVACSRALVDGELDLGADPETLRAQLLAQPGIGPWTAAYVAMRVLGDTDAWLLGDVALVAGAKAAGILPPDLGKAAAQRALEQRAAQWAPWRSYAAMHLWQAGAHRKERGT